MKRFLLLINLLASFFVTSQTTLQRGDVLFYGINGNAGCTTSAVTLVDNIHFLPLVNIEAGTVLFITDNGWQRLNNNFFGTFEGVIKLTKRNNNTINRGQIFQIKIPSSYTDANLNTLNPDWEITRFLTSPLRQLDVASVDQIFLFNNGSFETNTGGDHRGYFNNSNLVTAFNSKTNWRNLVNNSNDSGLPGDELDDSHDITLYHLTRNNSSNLNRYNGLMNEVSKNEWIMRLLNPNLWVSPSSCDNFNSSINLTNKNIKDENDVIELCTNEPLTISVDDNSIVSYRWYQTTTLTNIGGTLVAGATTPNFNPPTNVAGTFYYYCQMTYTLNWQKDGVNKSTSNMLPSLPFEIKILPSTTTITPIQINI